MILSATHTYGFEKPFDWYFVVAMVVLGSTASRSQEARDFASRTRASGARVDTVERDSIRLYFMLRPVGAEQYVVTRTDNGSRLASDLDFTERGGRVHVTAALDLGPDLTPNRYTAQGNSYRVFFVNTTVEARGGSATVRAIADSGRVQLPNAFFTVDGYAPVATQMMLVRYWKRHGRPRVLRTVPGDPTNAAEIERRGTDTIRVHGAPIVLERYSINGVVWGHESLWLDPRERLAAITTTAGLLPLEGVREEYAGSLRQLVRRAIHDRMDDLARLTRSVHPVADGAVALVGARLIDGTGAPPARDATILVDSGRIVAVGPSGSVRIPARAHVVRARGLTIIPGLWDSHAHASQIEWGPAYLGVGVTSIRDMGGEFDFLRAYRDALASGQALGPRVRLAGLIDGASPDAFGIDTAATPEQGRAEVDRYHAAGFQQIKIYDLVRPDVLAELTRAAHRAGMTVTGHIPVGMTVRAAVDSGMDQVAHMPMHVDTTTAEGRAEIAYFAQRHLLVDPTLSWNELLGHAAAEPIARFQPGVDEVPYPLRSLILSVHPSPDDTAVTHARVRAQATAAHILYEAGLPVVAGTDKGVPAFSLPRELEIYTLGGFTNLEALQSATIVPARALGVADRLGTIEPGKDADLVLLDADPLENISNIRRVHWVMSRGRLYDPATLFRSVGFRPVGARTQYHHQKESVSHPSGRRIVR